MEITQEVFRLDSTRGGYAYLIKGNETVLIDTGLPGRFARIKAEIEALGQRPEDIAHILLTHNDVDHIGNAAELQQWTGAPVWISAQDLRAMTGEEKRHGIKRIFSHMFHTRMPEDLRAIEVGQNFSGVRAIPSPGHTKGHLCFAYAGVLFAGDLIDTRKGGLAPLPGLMNWNTQLSAQSLGKVLETQYEWICPAHGQPVNTGERQDD